MFNQIPPVQFTIGLHLTKHFQMLLQITYVYLSRAIDILPQPTWAVGTEVPKV